MNWNVTGIIPDSVLQYSGAYVNTFQNPVEFSLLNTHESHQFTNEKCIEEKATINQKKIDEDFIHEFVLNIQENKRKCQKNCNLSITEGKNFLLRIIALKKKVESNAYNLDVTDENFDNKWNILMNEVQEINDSISQFNKDIKNSLKAAILKRNKKRQSIRKRKLKFKNMKEQKLKSIQEKHQIIDNILNIRNHEVEATKREAALKRQADSVLHEVRKKKYEGKKMLNLLSALSKLRELRSKQEEERGGYCSKQLTETFKSVISRFQNLWNQQMDVYKFEEKGLRIMLEENTLHDINKSESETNLLHWEKTLFGEVSKNENEEYLTMADSDIQAFISIRRDWDQFIQKDLTPMASSIPPGWVLPPETDNKEWKKFIKIVKKT